MPYTMVPVTARLQRSAYAALHLDKEIQLRGAYDRSMRCLPLLPGTGKAKVELLLHIQLE